MTGVLSDKAQAGVVTISLFLISLGAITPPDQIGWIGKLVLTILGIAGIAIKEGLGSKQ